MSQSSFKLEHICTKPTSSGLEETSWLRGFINVGVAAKTWIRAEFEQPRPGMHMAMTPLRSLVYLDHTGSVYILLRSCDESQSAVLHAGS